MAKETKTEQYYPNDNLVNANIRVKECFGWEVLTNQRCQERDGDMLSTFNKVTYNREKSSPWYPEVVELESQYLVLEAEIADHKKRIPKQPIVNPVVAGILFICYIFPGVIYLNKKKKEKKMYEDLKEAFEPKIKAAQEKQAKLCVAASALVNAQ